MKILVIDDMEIQRNAAKEQLTEHDLVFVGTMNEARDALKNGKFDIVLTDLMMPAEKDGMPENGKAYLDQQVPYGFVIALIALKKKAKVAMVTVFNHHDHPIFWAMDDVLEWNCPVSSIVSNKFVVSNDILEGIKDPVSGDYIWVKNWKSAFEKLSIRR